jgi:hypothetical protein
MATTTTNFGWDIPQSTDLVKDGATAIAALGQDIDTAMVDLKGGTTGQVLAKASGTDLDFSWVAQDDSNAIQNAIVDAKGDLIAATAADTPARLAVGTNGQLLTADSTAATGLKWSTVSSGGMTLLSTTTLSGASVTVGTIDQTYTNLKVFIFGVTNSTASGSFRIAPNGTTNGFSAVTTKYDSSGAGLSALANSYLRPSTAYNILNSSAVNSFALDIQNYASTTAQKPIQYYMNYTATAGGDATNEAQHGVFASTTAISSLVFTNTGGNFSAGTVLVYGVK